jgi:ribosomal 50S subunit-recycling heat shock protein
LKKGKIIKNAGEVKIGEIIEIMFQIGEVKSQVKEVKNG